MTDDNGLSSGSGNESGEKQMIYLGTLEVSFCIVLFSLGLCLVKSGCLGLLSLRSWPGSA